MKAGTNFQEAAHSAADFRPTFGGLGDLGENLQERALPRPVAADHTHDLAGLYVKR